MSRLVRDAAQLVPDLVRATLADDVHEVAGVLRRGRFAYGTRAVEVAVDVARERVARARAKASWKLEVEKFLEDR